MSLAALLLAAALATEPPAPVPRHPVPAAVAEAEVRTRGAPLAERMRAVSTPLLGAPYAADPEGEGFGHDPDPPARYDAFDCLTFVEAVLALTLGDGPEATSRLRATLRYGDQPPGHAARHHFMEAEWIPGALAAGLLRDTTARYGTPARHTRVLTAEDWARWPDRAAFPHPDERLPQGELSIAYLPLDAARQAVGRLTPGSVLLVVRADRADHPFWVTHLGLVLDVDGRRVLRHASQMRSARKVTDTGLAWYLDHLATYRVWPVAGVVVLEPVPQGGSAGDAP
ncbi:MAG: DUF1460 domain-containing protein [Alphaproteobacteria bacterium]|nr:DUF1460 domain-containing protein [Alphaproteobacteria bacterium]